MADLLQARRVMLMVTGAAKQGAMRRLLRGPITTQFPASLLQLHHDVTLLCDESAMSLQPTG
jgi:glucosamine-6-phosphate deaminase